MRFSLFRRTPTGGSDRAGKRAPRAPLSPALPEARELSVHLHLHEQQPFQVELHDMNIQGAELLLPFHLAPLGGEGQTVEVEVHHPEDGWRVRAVGVVRTLEKTGEANVLVEVQFTRLGDLYAQLDDALGRYFNRRSTARVKPDIDTNVYVKLSHGPHRVRGFAHDLSGTGLGVALPLAQAAVFKGGEHVRVTVHLPGSDDEIEGPGVVRHGYRSGPEVVLGVEFDLLADSPMRTRRKEFLGYVEARRESMEAWQQALSRPA